MWKSQQLPLSIDSKEDNGSAVVHIQFQKQELSSSSLLLATVTWIRGGWEGFGGVGEYW